MELILKELAFEQLNLLPEIKKAIDEMGFETATLIQSEAIPMIKTGVDVIGRSQTGTGKTIAFGIPALEVIDTAKDKLGLQVLILCPTRELAQQASDEIKKLSKYMHGIRAVEIYGGVPMDRQIVRLKKANIVIGTPGRIMDHMRRRTLKVNMLKMIVLDEADEMLNMGFKEDVETILTDTPETRQTILFSATMPPAIMSLTKQFQTEPNIIQVNSKQVTLENIEQSFIEVPIGKKLVALNILISYNKPKLIIIFCNTKKMVDEVTEFLCNNGFFAEGLHGDMKQSNRSKVMESFKHGKTSILVATDVAARGIDVNDVDYVINYDIPQNNEYYVHRIGRTGRAGKTGKAITICSGRRQVFTMKDIARAVKSDIKQIALPSGNDLQEKSLEDNINSIKKVLNHEISDYSNKLFNSLVEADFSPENIAKALIEIKFASKFETVVPSKITTSREKDNFGDSMKKIVINIGRNSRVAPNHVVGAITEKTGIDGSDIGKIDIFEEHCLVGVSADKIDEIVESMVGLKICGKPCVAEIYTQKNEVKGQNYRPNSSRGGNNNRRSGYSRGKK